MVSTPKAKVHILPFFIATGGEFIALYYWLIFFDAKRYALSTIVLWIGFLIERIAVIYWVKTHGVTPKVGSPQQSRLQALLHLLTITATEIVVWLAFFFVADRFGLLAAWVVLAIGEQLQHSWDLCLILGGKFSYYFFHGGLSLFITVVESTGGVALFYYCRHDQRWVGAGILLVALFIEHVVQAYIVLGEIKKLQQPQETPAQS